MLVPIRVFGYVLVFDYKAGTEYCLTYPYLNLGAGGTPQADNVPAHFNFRAAISIIKQARSCHFQLSAGLGISIKLLLQKHMKSQSV